MTASIQDLKDLIEEDNKQASIAPEKSSFISSFLKTPLEALKGAGKEVVDLPVQTVNAATSLFGGRQFPVPFESSGESFASKVGRAVTDIAIPGLGERALAAKAVGAIPEAYSLARSVSPKIADIFSRHPALAPILGGATFGDIKSSEGNRLSGTLGGAAIGAIPGLATSWLTNLVKPRQIVDKLSKEYAVNTLEAKNAYDSVLNTVGKEPLYKKGIKVDSKGEAIIGDMGEIGKIPPEIWNKKGPVKRLATQFYEDPTFENAHKLQSTIGQVLRDTNFKNYADYQDKYDLQQAQKAVKNDISSFFNKNKDDKVINDAKEAYTRATNIYRDKIIPLQDAIKETNPNKLASKLEKTVKLNKYTPDEIVDIKNALNVANLKRDASLLFTPLISKLPGAHGLTLPENIKIPGASLLENILSNVKKTTPFTTALGAQYVTQ